MIQPPCKSMLYEKDHTGNDTHYIFGYGSLINTHSRRITGIAGASTPVRVSGLQRYWVSFGNYPMRSVGVKNSVNSLCNGVVFPVPASEIALFDKREVGYVRQSLNPTNIDTLNGASTLNESAPIWVYMYQDELDNHLKQPISQAYLDVILLGCLETHTNFAEEFLQHTWLWDNWLDDRANPRYPRAIQHNQAQQLDSLIASQRTEIKQRYGSGITPPVSGS